MLFGKPDDFAIEATVDPEITPPSAVWGGICVWCQGAMLGDISLGGCALYPAYCSFRQLPFYIDELWAEELAGLSDEAAMNFLDELLYGWHGDEPVEDDRTLEEVRADRLQWGAFDFLTNWGVSFDGFKAFFLCPPGESARILSRQLPQPMRFRADVSRDGLLAAANGFVQWFAEQERRLRA